MTTLTWRVNGWIWDDLYHYTALGRDASDNHHSVAISWCQRISFQHDDLVESDITSITRHPSVIKYEIDNDHLWLYLRDYSQWLQEFQQDSRHDYLSFSVPDPRVDFLCHYDIRPGLLSKWSYLSREDQLDTNLITWSFGDFSKVDILENTINEVPWIHLLDATTVKDHTGKEWEPSQWSNIIGAIKPKVIFQNSPLMKSSTPGAEIVTLPTMSVGMEIKPEQLIKWSQQYLLPVSLLVLLVEQNPDKLSTSLLESLCWRFGDTMVLHNNTPVCDLKRRPQFSNNDHKPAPAYVYSLQQWYWKYLQRYLRNDNLPHWQRYFQPRELLHLLSISYKWEDIYPGYYLWTDFDRVMTNEQHPSLEILEQWDLALLRQKILICYGLKQDQNTSERDFQIKGPLPWFSNYMKNGIKYAMERKQRQQSLNIAGYPFTTELDDYIEYATPDRTIEMQITLARSVDDYFSMSHSQEKKKMVPVIFTMQGVYYYHFAVQQEPLALDQSAYVNNLQNAIAWLGIF